MGTAGRSGNGAGDPHPRSGIAPLGGQRLGGPGDRGLSAAARRRLGRPPAPPLRPPPIDDLSAVAAWRAEVHAGWLDGDPPAEVCGFRVDEVVGVRVLRSAPADGRPLILYLHGGGYVLGSPEVSLPITERLTPFGEVVSIDYRLAPEHPCPAAIDDAIAVHRALADRWPDRPVVLAGDSAGAGLALSVAVAARDRGGPSEVGGLLLLSPHVDAGPARGQAVDESGEPARPTDLDAAGRAWFAAAYRGPLAPDDPRLSPLRADLRDLPPMLIQVGTVDTSREQGIRLAERAKEAEVEVALEVWDGLWHTWHYHRDLPEADQALSRAGAFVERLSDGGR